jgi:hypothetical protein
VRAGDGVHGTRADRERRSAVLRDLPSRHDRVRAVMSGGWRSLGPSGHLLLEGDFWEALELLEAG